MDSRIYPNGEVAVSQHSSALCYSPTTCLYPSRRRRKLCTVRRNHVFLCCIHDITNMRVHGRMGDERPGSSLMENLPPRTWSLARFAEFLPPLPWILCPMWVSNLPGFWKALLPRQFSAKALQQLLSFCHNRLSQDSTAFCKPFRWTSCTCIDSLFSQRPA
ncbi:hypothetical protein BU25DRAFT_274466 [Macroventuria anomochaeta]|uniref:Uncharacterized protein n=1 Tax=Macroventuria anomochaeta TaxID=301207 RepID=A0ACB6S6B6_9PLEO|nr:uncharacterized protein BU25DRAFT_274466 [Macroventuria anomochaeta]KAF2629805.1 hypothetical protein BU25DRAFT_274466 [Macroventuria anomochaeta]